MAQAPRDQNRIPTLLGVDSATFLIPTTVAVNTSTHALLVEASFSPSGTQDVNLTKVGGTAISLGQTTMTSSLPVTLASDQTDLGINIDKWGNTSVSTAVTLADNISNPTAPLIGAAGLMWDGSVWRRFRTGLGDGPGAAQLLDVQSYVYDGTNANRPRSAINGTDSTGTGITAAGLLAQLDDTSPSAVTENQFGNVRMSSRRILMGAGDALELTAAGTGTGTLIGPMEVSNYKSVSVHSLNSFSGSIEFQVSNDNSHWEKLALVDTSSPINISTGNGGGEEMKAGNLQAAKYFRVQCTGYSSGTINLVVEFHTYAISTPVQTGSVDVLLKGYEINGAGDKEFRAYSTQITSKATTTPTSSDCWISTIVITQSAAGTLETLTLQDRQGTPLILINALAVTSLTAPQIYNFNAPIKMGSGIDIITAGTTAGTTNVWIDYVQ